MACQQCDFEFEDKNQKICRKSTIFCLIMDKELLRLLKESIPNRFLNLTPFAFEDFMGKLFEAQGYKVSVTKRSGDFGADVIADKGSIKIAIQVKRFETGQPVGVEHINQVIGAKQFYNCNKAMIITTSSFSRQGLQLAKETDVECWDIDKLIGVVNNVFLDDKNIYDYCKEHGLLDITKTANGIGIQKKLEFTVEEVIRCMLSKSGKRDSEVGWYLKIRLKNLTSQKFFVALNEIILIDLLGNQVVASGHMTDSFISGEIYPSASISIQPVVYKRQIQDVRNCQKVIIKYYENDSLGEEIIEVDFKNIKFIDEIVPVKQKFCFVVSVCFGENSPEYLKLTTFRDKNLQNTQFGKFLIKAYYCVGPLIAYLAVKVPILKIASRAIIRKVILILDL